MLTTYFVIFSLEVVRGWQSDFFFLAGPPDPTPVIEHSGIFSETHPKQSLCDVSLQMYYCASSVCGLGYLDDSVLAGLGISSRK